MAQKVLVTGGAGFIGSHLVERLLLAGDEIVVLDDLSTGKRANLPAKVRLVCGDIRDTTLLDHLMADVDVVFHLAALVSVQACIQQWEVGHSVNLGGTMAVLHAAHRAGNLPVIYASSAAIYGDQAGGICHESSLPRPVSPYAADKLACEHQARAMAEVLGLPSVGLRFFNVYGPRQDAASPYAGVISRFCANRLSDQPHVVFGDGGQSRDFIHVRDIAEGLVRARAHLDQGRGAGIFNLCTGVGTSLLDLTRNLDLIADRGPGRIEHMPARDGDIRISCGCPQIAKARLDFDAAIDIHRGLRDLWDALAAGGVARGREGQPAAKGSCG